MPRIAGQLPALPSTDEQVVAAPAAQLPRRPDGLLDLDPVVPEPPADDDRLHAAVRGHELDLRPELHPQPLLLRPDLNPVIPLRPDDDEFPLVERHGKRKQPAWFQGVQHLLTFGQPVSPAAKKPLSLQKVFDRSWFMGQCTVPVKPALHPEPGARVRICINCRIHGRLE
jgi:hypothetical protein